MADRIVDSLQIASAPALTDKLVTTQGSTELAQTVIGSIATLITSFVNVGSIVSGQFASLSGKIDSTSTTLAHLINSFGALDAREASDFSTAAGAAAAAQAEVDALSGTVAVLSGAISARINSLYAFEVTTFTAGEPVNAGYAVWQNSGANAFNFDPNSTAIYPHALALQDAAGVGSLFQALLYGLVQSIVPTSGAFTPGFDVFFSPLTPGMLVNGSGRFAGISVDAGHVLFQTEDRDWGRINTLSSALAVASNALSGRINTVSVNLAAQIAQEAADFGAAATAINAVSAALATASGALSARIDTAQSGVNGTSSTLATFSNAISGRVDTVSTNLAAQIGRIDALSSALAVESGALSARLDTDSSGIFNNVGSIAFVNGRVDTVSSNLAVESGALSARIDTLSVAISSVSGAGGPSAAINLIMNPIMEINQRATYVESDAFYGPDRWIMLTNTGQIACGSSQTFGGTFRTAKVPMATAGRFGAGLWMTETPSHKGGIVQILQTSDVSNRRGEAITLTADIYHTNAATSDILVFIMSWADPSADGLSKDPVNDWTSTTYTVSHFFSYSGNTVLAASVFHVPSSVDWAMPTMTVTIDANTADNIYVGMIMVDTLVAPHRLAWRPMLVPGATAATAFARPPHHETYAKCQQFFKKSFKYSDVISSYPGTGGVLFVGSGEPFIREFFSLPFVQVSIIGYALFSVFSVSGGQGDRWSAAGPVQGSTNGNFTEAEHNWLTIANNATAQSYNKWRIHYAVAVDPGCNGAGNWK